MDSRYPRTVNSPYEPIWVHPRWFGPIWTQAGLVGGTRPDLANRETSDEDKENDSDDSTGTHSSASSDDARPKKKNKKLPPPPKFNGKAANYEKTKKYLAAGT